MIYIHANCEINPNPQNENKPGVSVSKLDLETFGEPRYCPWCGKRALKEKPA